MTKKSTQTREQKLEEVVAVLGNALDNISEKLSLTQPGLAIWKTHGKIIEECREKYNRK